VIWRLDSSLRARAYLINPQHGIFKPTQIKISVVDQNGVSKARRESLV
jgi:hypothetical protein